MKCLILVSILLLYGCAETVEQKENREYVRWKEKQQIEACLKLGGIPMYSTWDGHMKECVFPKEQSK
jgi:hypothetical protein